MGSSWARGPGGFRGRDQVQDAMLSREAGGPVARGDEEIGVKRGTWRKR